MSFDAASECKANTAIEHKESLGTKFSAADVKPVPHYIVLTLVRFLEYCRPPFNDWDFMEVAHKIKSAADPDDLGKMEAFHMGEYNRLRKELENYVERK